MIALQCQGEQRFGPEGTLKKGMLCRPEMRKGVAGNWKADRPSAMVRWESAGGGGDAMNLAL